jgi:hypothetical protein
MKTLQLLLAVALCSALLVSLPGCDDDADNDAGGAEATGNPAGAGDQVSDAGDEGMDSSPIPKESFDQLKGMWDLQIAGAEEGAKTLMEVNEEHKDEQLAKMIDEINAKLAAIRKEFAEATPNDRQFLMVDLPKRLEEVGVIQAKAVERVQEVVKAKAGIQ